MNSYISPIRSSILSDLCEQLYVSSQIDPADFERFNVKRGLRNSDGSGVMAGLTKVCSVLGYTMSDGEKSPVDGKLIYRGIDINEIIENCAAENRFGFEEVVWLLLFGSLPSGSQLEKFMEVMADCRELPGEFIEDMIMKAPSPDIMNKLARSVLALYSYDENPDAADLPNVLRQSIQLIAQLPAIMVYAYQVKRRHYYHKSMYLHGLKKEHGTAETILHAMRADRKFTDDEAKLLDLCLILHAEHGGGNNSTFAARVLTSSGTDTYSAIAAGIGSLKGPKHGGANIKVMEMLEFIKKDVRDPSDEGLVTEYLEKLIKKEAGDRSGLIYGMGHAVYTYSDPRAVILKQQARKLAADRGFEPDFKILETVEKNTPDVFARVKGDKKAMCANVDLYSGLVYRVLGIPEDLLTPIFAVARIAGWCAHRIEELATCSRIMRPAYKSVAPPAKYVPIGIRSESGVPLLSSYIPMSERRKPE